MISCAYEASARRHKLGAKVTKREYSVISINLCRPINSQYIHSVAEGARHMVTDWRGVCGGASPAEFGAKRVRVF